MVRPEKSSPTSLSEQLSLVGLDLSGLTMDARGGLVASLDSGAEVVLGRGDIEAKLRRFHRVFAARQGRLLKRMDLRYSQGAAVAWAPAEQNNQGT